MWDTDITCLCHNGVKGLQELSWQRTRDRLYALISIPNTVCIILRMDKDLSVVLEKECIYLI